MVVTDTPIGIAYRRQLRIELFDRPTRVDYLEISAEDYFDRRGRARAELDALMASFTVIVHARGLSIGSADGIDGRYLERLAALIEYVRPPWWSDHLAFTRAGGRDIGHFVPLRRTRASIEIVARNADRVRQSIATPFALENLALPFVIPGGDLAEGAFLTAAAQAARCRLLLDVENLHANERNWGESADRAIAAIPAHLIAEIHIAGGRQHADMYIDSHDAAVPERTWQLARALLARGVDAPIVLERDAHLPNLAALGGELTRARQLGLSASA